MKKRILSFLLIAVTLLQLSAVTIFAAGANPAGDVIVADDSTSQNNGMSFAPGEKYVQEDYLFGDKDSTNLTMTLETTIYIPGDLLEAETPTHAGYIFSNRTEDNYLTDHHFSVCIQISSDKTYFYPRLYFGNAANKSGSGFKFYTEVAGTKLPTYEQVHLAITMQHNEADNTVSVVYYIDGKKTNNSTHTLKCNNTEHTEGHSYTAEKFHIGGMMYGDSSSNIANSFKGYMKNFAIYNDVRTASEISSDYSNGCSTNDVNLISYYKMGSTMSGEYEIKDWSQNQNDLIFTGEREGISFEVNDRYEQKYAPAKLGIPEVSAMTIEQSIVIPADAKKASGYILSNKRGNGTDNYIDTAVTYQNGNWYPTLYLGNGDGTYINSYVFTGLAIPTDK